MLTDGPLDVLTGDYLAELTMLILGRDRMKDPGSGMPRRSLRPDGGEPRAGAGPGVKIVTNAGGLNPAGLAGALREIAERLGLTVKIAHVEGETPQPGRGARAGQAVDRERLPRRVGIAECLNAGADVVVTGRVTDASVIVGRPPRVRVAADRLRPARRGCRGGHVIECGAQATGGNYAFFAEHDIRRPGSRSRRSTPMAAV